MAKSIIIDLPPVPKARPRMSNGHAYTPERTRQYENAVKLIARTQIKRVSSGAIRLSIHFYLLRPKSAKNANLRPLKRPDIDNLAKAILDALNGIAYEDDKQIVELHLYKDYSERPRTEIELEEI